MAEWRVNHEHNGLEVSFDGKPAPSVIASLKQNGFRWAQTSKVWYAKDYPHRREFLNTLATQGADVAASGASFAERMEEKAERAEARQDRLETAAEKASAEATRRFNTVHQIGDMIPMGQPILVGHHSEGRHRAAIKRMDTNMSKGVEATKLAQHLEQRAASTGANLKGYDKPGFLARRIKECEAELRKLQKSQANFEANKPIRDAYRAAVAEGSTGPEWQEKTGPGGAWYYMNQYGVTPDDHYTRLIEEQQSKLDYCNERMEALGGVRFGPGNISQGSVILGEHGLGVVRRANPTSVTVDYLNPAIVMLNPSKCAYGRIKEVKTAAEVIALLESKLTDEPNPKLSGILNNLRKLAV